MISGTNERPFYKKLTSQILVLKPHIFHYILHGQCTRMYKFLSGKFLTKGYRSIKQITTNKKKCESVRVYQWNILRKFWQNVVNYVSNKEF